MTERDFNTLAELIETHAGIRMPPTKRVMLEGRLRHRLRDCGMTDFGQYCRFLFEEGGLDDELTLLTDAVTTNKTEFFREPKHYEIFLEQVLPDLLGRGIGLERPLRVWSAGSSIGAEAYTLAMLLADAKTRTPGLSYQILGTDISTNVLATARKAIYPEDMAEPIPMEMRHRYLLRSRDRRAKLIRMTPDIRAKVDFRRLNFMDARYDMPFKHDIVFCRNVIIYFDADVRGAVLRRICDNLLPGGYLFMGHSENISGLGLPLASFAATVHVRC